MLCVTDLATVLRVVNVTGWTVKNISYVLVLEQPAPGSFRS